MESQIEGLRRVLGKRNPSVRRIAIASGKGGVGKTTIALNLSVALAEAGNRTLLLDADPGLADLHILLGMGPGSHWGHYVAGERSFAEVATSARERLDLVAGFSGYTGRGDHLNQIAPKLLEGLQSVASHYDCQVLDLGAGISEPVLGMAVACDFILLVLGPELTSLADAYGFMKTVVAREPRSHFQVVANNVADEGEARRVHANLTRVSAQFLGIRPLLATWLPRDPDVPKALTKQKPAWEVNPGGPFARGIDALVESLGLLQRS